jgi:hypothetical protein
MLACTPPNQRVEHDPATTLQVLPVLATTPPDLLFRALKSIGNYDDLVGGRKPDDAAAGAGSRLRPMVESKAL